MSRLKEEVYKGVFWSFIDKGSVRSSNFVIGILIARILTPADYGLVGMIMVFITISSLIIDSGISQALIQKKNRTSVDFSTAFIFNTTIAFICYGVLFIIAPYISIFYEEPILKSLLRILGLNLIIISLSTVQKTRLIAKLNFRLQAISNICGVIIGGTVGLLWAYYYKDVWAIVCQQITTQFTTSTLYWILSKWHPCLVFSRNSFKQLWKYGVNLLTAGLLSTILREINSLVIGKVYRPTELGYYSRAVQTSDMFAYTLNDIINAVTFPVLSKLQDEKERFNHVYLIMLEMTAFFIFPLLTILSALAKPIFLWLLTEKWVMAVPLFQWLCIARMLTPLTALNMNILNAKGKSGIVLKLELVKIPIIALGLCITLPISVYAVVIGNLITTIICYLINSISVQQYYHISILSQLKLIYKIIILCIIVFFTCYSITLLSVPNLHKIIIGTLLGLVIYIVGAFIFKISALSETYNFLQSKINKKNIYEN